MLEWTSFCVWPDKRKSNHFSDYDGMQYTIRTHSSLADCQGEEQAGYCRRTVPADKLQRLYPEPSQCFTMKDVDKRKRPDLWNIEEPEGLVNPEFFGESRFAFWNYRECCICNPGQPNAVCDLVME